MKSSFTTFLFFLITSFAVAQNSPDSGLVAYFPFNGNAIDATGNGYNGTINGNAALVPDRFGGQNNSFTFPDQSSNISLANTASLNLETGFTINAWIKYKNAYSVIVGKHTCGFVNGFIFGIDFNGKIALWLGNSSTWSSLNTNDLYNEDQWYMVTAAFDGITGTAKIYVNGEVKSNGNLTYNNFSTYPISIGEAFMNICSPANMSGAVDEVKIYNRALTDAEIQMEYSLSDDGLVAFYPFTGNANDESGNNNNLINNGANLTTDRFGIAGNAYNFSGSSNLSRVDSDLLDLTNDFSVSFWINRPGSIQFTFVMSKHLAGDDFSGSWGIASYAGGNTLTFAGTPNWGSGSNPITGVLSENSWHHVAFTYNKNSNEWKSFVDGALSNSGTQAFNIQNTNKDFMIGACMPNVSNITAALDDIRIYNRVIDPGEVLALYNDSTTYFQPLEDGLVAYWPFDGNTMDSTFNNNDGINHNGVFNKDRYASDLSSIYFDGVDSYVEGINPGNNLPTGNSPRSFSAWVKNLEFNEWGGNIFHYGTAQPAPTNFHFLITDVLGLGNGYGFGVVYGNTILNDSAWHFVTGVYEGGTERITKLYVDGKPDNSGTITSEPNTVLTTNWKVGRFMEGSSNFNGNIDELKVYDIPLTQQEVWDKYKATTTAPELLFPADNSTINTLTPIFDWDSTVTANYYEISVFSDSTLTTHVLDENSYTSNYQVNSGLLQTNTKYYWKIRTNNDGGLGPWSEVFNFDIVITDVEDEQQLPTEFALIQNYPNPFNPSTMITYHLPKASNVMLKVYDVLGNEIATLIDEEKPSGRYEVEFSGHFDEGQNLSSGIYFYQLKAGNYLETKKMIYLK